MLSDNIGDVGATVRASPNRRLHPFGDESDDLGTSAPRPRAPAAERVVLRRGGERVRWLHLAVGVAGVVGFLGTGQYMDKVQDHLRGMGDARRLLFRSTHLYLLFGSLVNLALGLYLRPALGWRRWVRPVGSALILATPFLAAAGFFTEPWLSGLERPYSRPAAYGCLAGMVLHLVCMSAGREPSRAGPEVPAP